MKSGRKEHVLDFPQEHILCCLSSSPSNARIIRTAARMAEAFDGQLTALFVETPDFERTSRENRQRLADNRELARSLGASLESVYGEDVAYQIAEYAKISGITKIVLGRSGSSRHHLIGKPALTEQLFSYVPEIDIYIIPDTNADVSYREDGGRRIPRKQVLLNSVKTLLILLAVTGFSLLFHEFGYTDANIIMLYILGVLLTAVVTSHTIYSLLSSAASVFIFNYLFTEPRFSLAAYETGYPVTFVVMFLTAYITGTLAARYKAQAGHSAKIAYRTKILYDTDRLLSGADSREAIFRAAAEQIVKLLGRDIVLYEAEGDRLLEPQVFRKDAGSGTMQHMDAELPAAEWVFKNNHMAGHSTENFPEARCLYLALRVNERVYGVIGIDAGENPLDASEHDILLPILGECALALENEKNRREKDEAAHLAESEQLRANMLRTISHDLRTPLTTISGNADNLLKSGESLDEETRKQIYEDIYDDSMWLNGLVENLLYSTRIEEGRMNLSTSSELLNEIVEAAMQHLPRKAAERRIRTDYADELLLVEADARLLVQVIINLVDNAVKYTPEGADITVKTALFDGMAEVTVSDTGYGIPEEEKPFIFEKFYTGNRKIADNRRSLGLGLYLCKSIVEAHGGTIRHEDNRPHGAVFRIRLPIREVKGFE